MTLTMNLDFLNWNECDVHLTLFVFVEAEDMRPWIDPSPPPYYLHSHLAISCHSYCQVFLLRRYHDVQCAAST